MKKADECGQALILIAGIFVVLVAFVGLVVDGGILFIEHGHLRRAVDTAALSAASEFRLGQPRENITRSALELIALNMPHADVQQGTTSVTVETCEDSPRPDFCHGSGERKFVRVTADHQVRFAFLPVIGVTETTIHADAMSEAASIDLVLVIDTSESMAFDAPPGDPSRDPTICNPSHACHPFEEVREAASLLMDYMYFNYDRAAVVTFDRIGVVRQEFTTSRSTIDAVIESLEIFNKPQDPALKRPWLAQNCPDWGPDMQINTNPTGCLSTNSGDGLRKAGMLFRDSGRDEAVWVVIFLSDGIANTGNRVEVENLIIPPQEATLKQWICPESTRYQIGINESGPFCTDGLASSRHPSGSLQYDAEDYARDMADWLACPAPGSGLQNACGTSDGLGAVVFSVGLGERLLDARGGMESVPYTNPLDLDLGEQLLRYIGNVGFDANPLTDECAGVPPGTNCGNYYFASSGADVAPIFQAIAERIFTRIVH
jgi:Flp pilus assembly protein TadG